jgi:hypothetical protein
LELTLQQDDFGHFVTGALKRKAHVSSSKMEVGTAKFSQQAVCRESENINNEDSSGSSS